MELKPHLFSLDSTLGWRPFPNAILLGDSGYGMLPWLLTPNVPRDLPTNGARKYLRRLKNTRQLIECSIGILKEKFPCLNYLRFTTPEKCCHIILACITLHNIEIITKNTIRSFESVDLSGEYINDNLTSADDVLADIVAQFETE